MSKILITGNGFDLFHGLPTKYGHFMAVMEVIEDIEEKEVYGFYDLFNENFGLEFFNDNERIHQYYDVEKIKFNKDLINKLKVNLNNNLLYNFFKNRLNLNTWIDFETEINTLLGDLILLFDHVEDKFNGSGTYRYDARNRFDKFRIFGIVEGVNHEVFRINEVFLSRETQYPMIDKILEVVLSELKYFTIIFNIYVSEIIFNFFNETTNKIKMNINAFDKIFTFNYTPTIENLYNIDINKIVYLHGKCNQDDKIQNIVLGVSEINDKIKNFRLFEFTKYFQKIVKNTNESFIIQPEEKNDLNQTNFYIIGHSLDESDKEYIEDLFNFLKTDKNKFSKIYVFYYNENDYRSKLNNLFKIIDKNIISEMHKSKRLCFEKLTVENIENSINVKLMKSGVGIYNVN